MKSKNKFGFTLIELLVVVSITSILALVSVSNFREGEKRKRVTLAIDGIVNSINLAQNYTLSGKTTNNVRSDCRVPKYFYVQYNYTKNYYLYAVDNCDEIDLIETYTLPTNVSFQASGLLLNAAPASNNLKLAYYPPFGQTKASIDASVLGSYTSATISVVSSDGTISKSAVVNGVSGRITQ
ncbi:MAG: prepilin-type N-terminal cleavage/methylation domain-containing protein [Candidatus Doudnabacteria bacterium]|nr:prepilin-type N-terminal cleavage/methylation domain-containing protein [Candidatus Doudnabacteria bacterium]